MYSMKFFNKYTCACITSIFLGLANAASVRPNQEGTVIAPDGKGGAIQRKPTTEIEEMEAKLRMLNSEMSINNRSPMTITGPILYHGGPLMLGQNSVYFVFYGSFQNLPHTQQLMTDLVVGLNGSPYYNINAAYYDGSGVHVSNSLAPPSGKVITGLTYGSNITEGTIAKIVTDSVALGSRNAIYVVLTGYNISGPSGFCQSYCGWHTHLSYSGSDIKYAFIGDGDKCPSNCQKGRSFEGAFEPNCPTGDCAGDNMASVVAHEISESVTDPDLNAWYDASGNENADKCAWTFGPKLGGSIATNDIYDVVLHGRPFELQENWIPPNGGCSMSY